MQAPPCSMCNAVCCRQTPDHDFAVILLDEEAHLFPEAVDRPADPDACLDACKVLPYKDGACVHLVNDRCSIYDRRPTLCREFTCLSSYRCKGEDHGFFLEDNPHVLELIELAIRQH